MVAHVIKLDDNILIAKIDDGSHVFTLGAGKQGSVLGGKTDLNIAFGTINRDIARRGRLNPVKSDGTYVKGNYMKCQCVKAIVIDLQGNTAFVRSTGVA